MKRSLAMMAFLIALTGVAAPAGAGFMTATFLPGSTGSFGIGTDGTDPVGNMIGASFVVSGGTFHMTGVGATFDGNVNLLPGLGVQKIFAAIVPLSAGNALPSFAPGDIAAHAVASFAFAPPTVAGDFTVPTNLLVGPGAYAAIFGSAGLLGSNAAGEAGLADGNMTIDTPNIFSNFTGASSSSWAAFGFDTGIRIFETGTVPEPSSFLLLSMALPIAVMVERRRRRRVTHSGDR